MGESAQNQKRECLSLMCEVCDTEVDSPVWVADPDATSTRTYLVDRYDCAEKILNSRLSMMFLGDILGHMYDDGPVPDFEKAGWTRTSPVPDADSASPTGPASSSASDADTSSHAVTSTDE